MPCWHHWWAVGSSTRLILPWHEWYLPNGMLQRPWLQPPGVLIASRICVECRAWGLQTLAARTPGDCSWDPLQCPQRYRRLRDRCAKDLQTPTVRVHVPNAFVLPVCLFYPCCNSPLPHHALLISMAEMAALYGIGQEKEKNNLCAHSKKKYRRNSG